MAKRIKRIYDVVIRRTDGNSIVSPDITFKTDDSWTVEMAIASPAEDEPTWVRITSIDGVRIVVRAAWVIDCTWTPVVE